MRKNKRLAAVLALTTLVGASAFAESRHSDGTRSRGEGRDTIRRSRDAGRAESRGRNESRNDRTERRRESSRETVRSRAETRSRETYRQPAEVRPETRSRETYQNRSRSRTEAPSRETYRNEPGRRNDSRSRETYRHDRRNDSRSRESYRENSHRYGDRSYRNDHRGRPHYSRGRVSRVSPYRGGYHVYVHGARYPYYIPHRYYHRDRFRVGLIINLGGYYNSGGYYDYYDGRSSADLTGVVESVDYRRDTFVIRNDASGSFVTVVMNDRYPDNIRPGDYVEITGDWSRAGVFRAYDVDRLDAHYR